MQNHNHKQYLKSILNKSLATILILLPLISFSQEFWTTTGSIPANTDAFRLTTDSQNRIYVGVNGAGVFVSSDGGISWVNRGLSGENFMDLTTNTADEVFVTAGNQIYKTSNQGINWDNISAGLPNVALQAIAFDAEGRIFVGLYGQMIYRSIDNGTTWTALTNGLSNQTVYVSMAINSRGFIYAGTNGAHIYRSLNQGDSWQRLTEGLSSPEVWALEIDSEDRIFAGTGNGIYISNDSGNSWSLAPQTEDNFDVNDMALDSEDHVFVTNYHGGVWRTVDHGTTWEDITDPHVSEVSWGLTTDSQGYLYCGAGNGQVYRSTEPTITVEAPPFVAINAGLQAVASSSVKWGDYDNDGDLDFIMVGRNSSGNHTKIYRNDGSDVFIDIQVTNIQNVANGPVTWGDYDNDGDLDILMTGYDGGSTNFAFVYRNEGSDIFTDQSLALTPMGSGSIDWVDYDNDGDLDIFTAGWNGTTNYAIIYRNDDNTFTNIGAELQGVRSGVCPWGDYDNDGDLDLLITGRDGSSEHTILYRNDNSTFTEIDAGLEVISGAAAWGDYDNDGDLDLVQSGDGQTYSRETRLYQNNSGTFSEVTSGLPGFINGSLAWGDYDNDGDQDLLMTGNDDGVNFSADVFENNNGTFTGINAGISGTRNGGIGWADYDNDGDLDLIVTGQKTDLTACAQIYRNEVATANTTPQAPANLQARVSDTGAVIFTWDQADSETPQAGLTYNIRIGTTPGGSEIKSAHADPSNGFRKIVDLGNAQKLTQWTIQGLTTGVYYWSVQAIDQGFAGSLFAAEQSFGIGDLPSATTEPASNIDVSAATLNGLVNPNGFETAVIFEYGLLTSYGNQLAASTSPINGISEISVDADVSGLQAATEYHYRVVVTSATGSVNGADRIFTTLEGGNLPVVSTGNATDVTASSATLNGTVNPGDLSTTIEFEFGLTTSYGSNLSLLNPINGSDDQVVNGELTGLQAATQYHYRIVATNSLGSTNGEDEVFTTLAEGGLPTSTTDAATAITTTTATLNGTVNPADQNTVVIFQYGLSEEYDGQITALQSPFSGTESVAVSANLSNLTRDEKYHFRVVATNSLGTTYGLDQFFMTMSAANSPTAITTAATNIAVYSARLNGTVNPGDQSTEALFEYGLTTSYGSQVVASSSPVEGTADIEVSASLTDLLENTEYHFRLVANNATGSSGGNDQVFTTLLNYPETFVLEVNTDFPTHENADEYTVTDYRLFGLPGASNMSASDILNGNHAEAWQLFWDNGADSDYLVEFDGGADFNFSVGRAFWVINKGRIEVNGSVPAATLNGADQIEIPLHPGWNLITNPVMMTLSWATIQSLNGISDPIWSYSGSFSNTDNFESYRGYYYFNGDDRSTLQIPYEETTLSRAISDIQDTDHWKVGITLTSGGQQDYSAQFGIASDALTTQDNHDYRKPHAVGDVASITFNHPEWDEAHSAFASDIRPPIEDLEQWEFVLEHLDSEISHLSFEGLDQLPDELAVFLINTGDGSTVNLLKNQNYEFLPSSSMMKFVISVGTREQVKDYINTIKPESPFMSQNYPNPFNPTTSLSYALPEAASMSLIVYDIHGEMVKKLHSGQQSAGWYVKQWDGVDEAGQSVPAGLYFARLQAGTYSNTIKMLMIK